MTQINAPYTCGCFTVVAVTGGFKMKVVPFRRRHCAESVSVLRHLLERAERGEILGLAICAKVAGEEEITFSGDYRVRPDQALSASMRMSWRLTKLQDEA